MEAILLLGMGEHIILFPTALRKIMLLSEKACRENCLNHCRKLLDRLLTVNFLEGIVFPHQAAFILKMSLIASITTISALIFT